MTPLVGARDIVGTPGLPVLVAAARAVPEERWPALCRLLAHAMSPLGLGAWGMGRALDARIRRALGGRSVPVAPHRIAVLQNAEKIRSVLLTLKYRGGRAGRPRIRMQGDEHLRTVLEGGRGALLLVHLFHETAHLFALSDGAYSICRLSDDTHGYFGKSRFGRKFLNPILVAAERQPGIERIVARAGSLGHLRKLGRALRENRLLLFRAIGAGSSEQVRDTVEVPLLEGRLNLSTVPFRMAAEAEVPLLPVHSLASGPASYEVVVDAPIAVESVETAAREVARRLEPRVLEHPDQWDDWRRLEFDR